MNKKINICILKWIKRVARQKGEEIKLEHLWGFSRLQDLGHLKEYGWISSTAATAELNLSTSPAGGGWVRRRGKEEVNEGAKMSNGKKGRSERWNKKRRKRVRRGDKAIDTVLTGTARRERREMGRDRGSEKRWVRDLSEETAGAGEEMERGERRS